MEVTAILGVLLFIADVWAVIRIVGSNASNGTKAIWIIVVLVLPILGLVLWYLMGPGRPS